MTISVETQIAIMQADIRSVKEDISEVKSDIGEVRVELAENSKAIVRLETIMNALLEEQKKTKDSGSPKESGLRLSFKEIFLVALAFALVVIFLFGGGCVGDFI